MENTPKKTVGAIAYDMEHKPQEEMTFFEQAKADMTGMNDIIQECYKLGKKGLPHKDFFVEILLKWEKILGERTYSIHPFVRKSCPTPNYDQTVFHYHHHDDLLEYLWTLPDKESYEWYVYNQSLVTPDRYALLKYVLDDASGKLLNKADELNKKLFG